jgi:hypothetical protein
MFCFWSSGLSRRALRNAVTGKNVTGCSFSMSHFYRKAAKAVLSQTKQSTSNISKAGAKRPVAPSEPPMTKKPAEEEPVKVRANTRTEAEEESYSCPAATVSLQGENVRPMRLTDPCPPAHRQERPPPAAKTDHRACARRSLLHLRSRRHAASRARARADTRPRRARARAVTQPRRARARTNAPQPRSCWHQRAAAAFVPASTRSLVVPVIAPTHSPPCLCPCSSCPCPLTRSLVVPVLAPTHPSFDAPVLAPTHSSGELCPR